MLQRGKVVSHVMLMWLRKRPGLIWALPEGKPSPEKRLDDTYKGAGIYKNEVEWQSHQPTPLLALTREPPAVARKAIEHRLSN